MLFAILYDENERLVAAALACEQRSFGNDYWTEIYPAELKLNPQWQTAYVDVADPSLRGYLMELRHDERLLSFCHDELECLIDNPARVTKDPRSTSPRAA